jgi:3-dehydroquinate synthase
MSSNTSTPIAAQTIHQEFSIPFSYKVHFTHGLFDLGNTLLLDTLREDGHAGTRKLIFVVDSEVARLHPALGEQIAKYCQTYRDDLELCAEPVTITGGEEAKNRFELVEELLQQIDQHKIDRHSYVLAIGGGAILDLVGFVAAIAHRGIRHVRIPTTVLSQNDSGVGVKNGINYFNKKNYLGTFVPPFAVLNDFDFLTTLHERDWRAGISEAVKVALIREAGFFHWIADKAQDLNQRDMPAMEELIYRCAQHHMAHIATNGDPFELGSSRPLDFGHWAAHKLEQITGYEVRHGEAVAIGIALDVAYSVHVGLLERSAMTTVHQCLQDLGFTLTHPALLAGSGNGFNPVLWAGLEEFREHLGGQLTIMLLDRIGHGVEVHEIDRALLDLAVQELN